MILVATLEFVILLIAITGPFGTRGLWWFNDGVTVKLYGGNDTAGVVQVYHDDKWGTICDDGWDNMDARVVCRQLKLEGSNQKYLRNSPDFFNISLHHDAELSSLPVMFINVDCDGTESSLLDCPRQVVNNNECLHDEDAGVICSRPDVTTGAMTTDAMTTDAMTTYVMTTDAMTTDAMTTDAMTTYAMMEDVVTTEKPSHVDTETKDKNDETNDGIHPQGPPQHPIGNTQYPDPPQIELSVTSGVNSRDDDVISSSTSMTPSRPLPSADPKPPHFTVKALNPMKTDPVEGTRNPMKPGPVEGTHNPIKPGPVVETHNPIKPGPDDGTHNPIKPGPDDGTRNPMKPGEAEGPGPSEIANPSKPDPIPVLPSTESADARRPVGETSDQLRRTERPEVQPPPAKSRVKSDGRRPLANTSLTIVVAFSMFGAWSHFI